MSTIVVETDELEQLSLNLGSNSVRMFGSSRNTGGKPLDFKFPLGYPDLETYINTMPDFFRCEICQSEIAFFDSSYVNGCYICSKCKNEHVLTCNCCHYSMFDLSETPGHLIDGTLSKIKAPKMERINGIEGYICLKCKNTKFTVCNSCGTSVLSLDCKTYGGKVFCKTCADEKLTHCNSCNNLKLKSQLIDGICVECFRRNNALPPAEVRSYGHKPEPVFISLVASGMLPYYGIELEIDNGRRTKELMSQLGRFKEIYLKSDGSLNETGIEIVSYPMNLDYHKNQMDWQGVFSAAETAGYKSHNTYTCGYHIHVGRNAFGESPRNQSKYIAYFLHLIMKFKREIKIFSRRVDFGYCNYETGYNLNNKITREYQSYVYQNTHERHMVVNCQNTNTIEIRVFRGTLNRIAFIASISLIDTLIKMVLSCKTEEEIRALKWSNVKSNATTEELKQYLIKKNL